MSADDEYKNLMDRSSRFLSNAEWNLNEGYTDIGSFSANQSLELFIRALLTCKLGDYPHTHNLRLLLETLESVLDKENGKILRQIFEEKRLLLNLIQDAYVTSRYFFSTIDEESLREIIETVKEIRGALDDIC